MNLRKTFFFIHPLRSFSILILACLIFFTTSCTKSEEYSTIQKSGTYFDTVITVTLYDASKTKELEHCFEIADFYEKLFSTTIEESEISKINQAKGNTVSVSDDTIDILSIAISYAKEFDGIFDPSVGRLSKIWQDSMEKGILPEENDVISALSTVDYQNILIEENTVTLLNPDMELDLGGIAKGYIADKMKEYLVEEDIISGMINLGGNVLAIGEKPDHNSYMIGIQLPFSNSGEVCASVEVNGKSVVTSGDYERYIEVDDKIYHHIIDLSTGYPVENDIDSVTVITENSVDGDALSTILFILGAEKGLSYVESNEEIEAVYLMKDGSFRQSSGMSSYNFMER